MMRRAGKKFLSVILSAALVCSGTHYGNFSETYAMETDNRNEEQDIQAVEEESTLTAESTEYTTEKDTDVSEEDTAAITERAVTDDETVEEEIQEVNAMKEEAGTEKAPAMETDETEAETDEEIVVTATSGTCGDNLTWTYDSASKTLTISGTGKMTDFDSDNSTNPNTAPWRNSDCYGCEKVVISESVTSIGNYAFYNCDKLQTVSLSNTVTRIGNGAFRGCAGLKAIEIPGSVEKIDEDAFRASGLTNIEITSPVTVGSNAFGACGFLTSASITYAANAPVVSWIFDGCDSLTTVTLKGRISTIENRAFSRCYKLETINIPDGTPDIEDAENSEDGPFATCNALTTINVPNGFKNIGKMAFYKREKLSGMKLAEGAETIGDSAFDGCTALNSIEIPKSVTSIGESAFTNAGLKSIIFEPRVNSETLTINDMAFNDTLLEELEIPANTTVRGSMYNAAFAYCGQLKKVVINENVSLGKNAFRYGTALEEVIIGKNVSIDDSAFENCNSNILMKLYKGSGAHEYVKKKGYKYKYLVEEVRFTPDQDNKEPREIAVGEAQLEIELLPDNSGTNNDGIATIADNIKWESGDTSVVLINSNAPTTAENKAAASITAVKEGTCTITVTCDGIKAACEIKVMVPAQSVTASPASGSVLYSNAGDKDTVTLDCATEGAVIYYTTDGSDPTKSSSQYTAPLSFDGNASSVTVKAFAAAEGYLDSDVSTFEYTVKKKAEGIAINKPDLTLGREEVSQLSVRFTPEGAEPETTPVVWQSDDEEIVSVVSDTTDTTKAEVTAKKAGTCTITATCGAFTASCEVTVNDKPRVSQVTAEPDSGEVESGTKVALYCATSDVEIYYTTDGSEPTNQSTRYEDDITVGGEMTIKAVAVKSGYDDSAVAVFTYTIKEEKVEITDITLNKTDLKLGVGKQDTLKVSVQPENAAWEEITWESSDHSVAEVQKNAANDTEAEITGKKAGTCTIKVICGSHTAQCSVTVTEKDFVEEVKADPEQGAVGVGTKVTLTCGTEGATIYYTIDDTVPTEESTRYENPIPIETAVTIKAVAVKAGYENSAVSTFAYTIAKDDEIPITGISLDKTQLALEIGKTDNLTVRFQPSDAAPENVEWIVNNNEIADVKADGTKAEVTGKKVGSCTITVTCGEYKAACIVTVTSGSSEEKRVSEVKAEPGSGAVEPGTKVSLTCDTEGAEIYYTIDAIDDAVPTEESTRYKNPIPIETAVTIRAIAVKEGYEDSVVSTFAYTIATEDEVPITGISLDRTSLQLGLEETGYLTVNFQPSDAAPQAVEWRSDNPEIADVSEHLGNPASVKVAGKKEGQCTITASCQAFTASCSVTVTGEKRVSVVYAVPSAQSAVVPGTKAELHCDTPDAAIYYTLDGAVPTRAGTRYTGAIVLNKDTTIKAVAVKDGYADSPVAAFVFTVNEFVPEVPDIDQQKEGIWITAIADQPYTGSAIKPTVYVYDGKKLLTEKTDYTISYKNNKNPGTGQVIVTGKGNYKDKKPVEFKIVPRNISDTDVIIEDMAYAYDGKVHKTVPVITHNGKKLKYDKDFKVTYSEGDYIEAGSYELTIEGIGNYTGKASGVIRITGKDKLLSKAAIASIPAQQYNKGNAVTPDNLIKVTLGGQTLRKDMDYIVSYAYNTNPGKATVIVKGKGDYAGTKKAAFKIVRAAVNMNEVTCTNEQSFSKMEFVKGGCTPFPILEYDGYILRAGTDYTVSYKNNKKVNGSAKLVVSGKGNFKGKIEIGFEIIQKNISQVSMYTPNVPYTGKANKYQGKPILMDSDGTRLKVNTDYTLTFSDGSTTLDKRSNPPENTMITVTVKGKGNYSGERSDTYVLSGISFSKAKISIANKVYTGNAVTISKDDIKSATIKAAGEKLPSELTYGEDYEVVSYSKNVKKGTATVVLCGKGKYCGEKSVKFKIVNRSMKDDK